MVTSTHSDSEDEQAEGSEPGEDGYWPALEILNERKHDYLVDWDGIDPKTGRAWSPSWTRKTEVTEDLIEAWEAKKAAKKSNRRGAGKPKRSHATAAPTPSKPAVRNSRSSRTSQMSSSLTTCSSVISLTSDSGSHVSGEHSLGKRKRQNTRRTPANEDPKPVSKKQRVNATSSSASQKSRTKSTRSPGRVSRETIYEEKEDESPIEAEVPDKVSRSPSPKASSGNAVVRIGPPRKRKKIGSLPPVATLPPSRVSSSAFIHSQEEEEEGAVQGAADVVPYPDTSPPAVRKKKRRLKPASSTRPELPVLAEKKPLVPSPREITQEPQEPSNQEEPFEADLPPLDKDDEPIERIPEPTPPRSARQQMSPADDDLSTSTPPRPTRNTMQLGHVPRLEPPLLVANTTSAIDEFNPKTSLPALDHIEASAGDSQADHDATEPRQPSLDPGNINDPLNVDITQEVQGIQDAYSDFDDRATGNEVLGQEQPTTDPGSTEQDPLRSQSPLEPANGIVPVQSFNSQELEDALAILNQKSEEIEVLESRLAAQEAQIEHLQAENYRIQVECEKLSVTQEVQREALEEAKGTVSELCVHIDWLQDSLDKSEAKVKQLQGEMGEIRGALDVKVELQNLAQVEWEKERTALEARLASSEGGPSQQLLADWELEKKELEDRLAEVTKERNRLEDGKRYVEGEAESWKEQYRTEVTRSQELRQEAKDARAESSRVHQESMIVASQTKHAVRLVELKYEAAIEKLRVELTKAESLYKVLQAKDEQTGDEIRRRAMSALHLQDEVLRLRKGVVSEVAKEAARAAEVKHGGYICQFPVNDTMCDQCFDSPQELWTHVIDGHLPSRGQR